MKYAVTSIGEPIIDFVSGEDSKNGNPTFEAFAGGGAMNVLAQVGMLDKPAAMLGVVGEDVFGDYLLKVLSGKGVDTKGVHRTNVKHTGIGFVSLNAQGERSFTFYREPEKQTPLFVEEDKGILEQTSIFHFTSVSMSGETIRESTFCAAEFAKEAGAAISFDVNYRSSLWKSEEEAKKEIRRGICMANIVKLSDEEREFLFAGEGNEGAAKKIHEAGVSLVCISLGKEGCFYSLNGRQGRIKSVKAKSVDTTGCGDAFMGVLLGLLSEKKKDFRQLPEEELAYILRRANTAGALCAERHGSCTVMAGRNEIEERLKGEGF